MNYKQDEEISLIDIFLSLWRDRVFISIITFFSVTIGSLYLSFKEPVYESKILFTIDSKPPNHETYDLFLQFEKSFFSRENFDGWKSKDSNFNLTYQDISFTQKIDGTAYSIDEDKRFATFINKEKQKKTYLLIRSNHSELLDNIYSYANHINDMLRDQYLVSAYNLIESEKKKSNTLDVDTDGQSSQIYQIRNYIEISKNKTSLFYIRPPSLPEKISPNTSLTLIIFFIIGISVSSFYILFKNAIIKRNKSR